MMRRKPRGPGMLLPAACLLALAACHKETRTSDQRTASGEVLAGSISDSMIPYEAVTSQPPLAPRESATSGAKAGKSGDNAPVDPVDAVDGPDAGGAANAAPAPSPSATAPVLY